MSKQAGPEWTPARGDVVKFSPKAYRNLGVIEWTDGKYARIRMDNKTTRGAKVSELFFSHYQQPKKPRT